MEEVGAKDKEISQEVKQLDVSINRLHSSVDQLETTVIDVLLPDQEAPQAAKDEAQPMTELGRSIRGLRERVVSASENVEKINGRVQI